MKYNRDLCKRFVSDYKLPIPLIKEKYFTYYLSLYEEDYGALTKYDNLAKLVDKRYEGNPNLFLDEYYNVRENIIQSVLSNPSFDRFNKMDLNCYSIKYVPQISKNNIYNESNIGKFFISIDLKKANFQALKNVNKDIVFGADTYEDFVGKFTDLNYIKESKYFREVIFGKMNPKRHITVEKYYIVKIYNAIIDRFPNLNCKAVSLSNDEVVFKDDFLFYNDKWYCHTFRKEIENIAKSIGFDIHVEFFHLKGYRLLFKESKSIRTTFYYKDYIFTDAKFKLISLPLPYYAIGYKLFKRKPIEEYDYHFNYEGMDARICEEFDIEDIGEAKE